ncbi:glycosyltransferase family 4 protein [Candidatus Woesearchaeota archaeon]|nr:glycosyltransferase family 4 protein [Candidatus Woesearchaeota archaeon]
MVGKDKDRIKVAMIGLRGIPASNGGIEVAVEEISTRLAKLGCDVTVFCRSQYCLTRHKSYRGVNLKNIPTLNTKTTEAIVHSTAASMVAALSDFDIVHFHAMANGIFSLLPKIAGKKTVVTFHGIDWEREKWGRLARAYIKFSERATYLLKNKVISVSNKIKDYCKNRFNFTDVTVIPNGVNIPKSRLIKSLKRFGLKRDGYILFLSRIVPEKEAHTLVKAFRKLKTRQKLVIAGPTTHTDDYLKKVKESAGDDKRIIFTGPLYGDEKTEAFSNCSFFVLPSTIEGMPIVLLEAMSFGKCPLVSDIAENLEVVDDSVSFSFKVRTVNDLARKMDFMLKHKATVNTKGRKAKELVKQKYNWDKIAEQTLEVYRKALGRQ